MLVINHEISYVYKLIASTSTSQHSYVMNFCLDRCHKFLINYNPITKFYTKIDFYIIQGAVELRNLLVFT
ncbi:hypothetical protein RHMOL_Rhmol06G0059000 [Rhododendron molle]|uniref:Uncharacterized protein n=1 Tax=Rhododendron molle TaxID=49168 RepID=A0ACC0N9C2_RHOML|nr:hypothetical protein RHMOL_Rhmol06G0059000 [Rhododendron molle]